MWPALLVLAASAFLKYQNDKQATSRQDSLRQAMEAYQRARAKDTEAATEELVQKQTPKERGTELANITADRTQSLKDTVGAAQAFDQPMIAGKLSGDYRATEEANAGRIAERTRRAIEQLASIGAPAEQQQRFGLRFGKAAGTVDAANRAAENVGRGYTGAMSRVRPDPTLDLISQIGMGVGGGMLGGAAGTAGTGTDVVAYGGAGDVASSAPATNYGAAGAAGGYSNYSPRRRVNRAFSIWGA